MSLDPRTTDIRQHHTNQYLRRVSQDALRRLVLRRRRCTRVSDSQMTWLQAARRTEEGRKEGRKKE